jgi:pimeloyl-ACP methyl ester carboxylesterase
MSDIHYIEIGPDLRLAYRYRRGRGPVIVFLPGYRSDMEGIKATALDAWAAREGRAMLRFDYAGCGSSDGAFEAQTLAAWRGDVLAMLDDVLEGAPAILVGSSMGGWLMLLAALARPEQVKALVGIAAAPDFTHWGFTQDQKMTILREGKLEESSPYGNPLVTTRAFWESGESLRLLHAPIGIDCPVRLIHGQKDATVAWTWSLELMKQLRSADVHAALIKDGDHSLSRDGDIAALIATVETVLEVL